MATVLGKSRTPGKTHQRVAWIHEDSPADAPDDWSGTFSGEIEGHRPAGPRPSIERVAASEAIAWGRSHAEVVYLQVNGVTYSLGTDTEGDSNTEWPFTDADFRPRAIYEPPGDRHHRWRVELRVRGGTAALNQLASLLAVAEGCADFVDVPDQSTRLFVCSVETSDTQYVEDVVSRFMLSALKDPSWPSPPALQWFTRVSGPA